MSDAAADASDTRDASAGNAAAGPVDAAILLMALGEEEAAAVLRYMEPGEVQAIGEAMSAIHGLSQREIGQTLERFAGAVPDGSSLGMDSESYFRSTLTRAVGAPRANGVLSRMSPSPERGRPTSLKWMHPASVVRLLDGEHPQLIATVLGLLPRAQAGDVLERLPAERHADLVWRIGKLDTLHPEALAEIDELLQSGLAEDSEVALSGLGGIDAVAGILNAVGKSAEEAILAAIDAEDEAFGVAIREGMFKFENLLEVDGRSLQRLLRELGGELLVLALKGASAEVLAKLLANMSKNAAALLEDDLAAKGPVRLSEVEGAQREILDIAKRLDAEGEIQLGGGGEALV